MSKEKDDLSFIQATIIAMDIERRPLTGRARDMVSEKIVNISTTRSQHKALVKGVSEYIELLEGLVSSPVIRIRTIEKLKQLLEEEKV